MFFGTLFLDNLFGTLFFGQFCWDTCSNRLERGFGFNSESGLFCFQNVFWDTLFLTTYLGHFFDHFSWDTFFGTLFDQTCLKRRLGYDSSAGFSIYGIFLGHFCWTIYLEYFLWKKYLGSLFWGHFFIKPDWREAWASIPQRAFCLWNVFWDTFFDNLFGTPFFDNFVGTLFLGHFLIKPAWREAWATIPQRAFLFPKCFLGHFF